MTLGVTGFNLEVKSFASAATEEFEEPARTTDAGGGEGRRGQGRNPPARGRRRGLAQIGGVGDPAPSSDSDSHLTALLGRQLQSTRRGHRKLGDFADHPCQAAMAQAFLHGGQDARLVARLGEEHALRRQTDLSQGRREEIALP